MMSGMSGGTMGGMKGDVAMRRQMMDKRIDLMQSMMMMLLERASPAPPK
jgi:hypothetical protein